MINGPGKAFLHGGYLKNNATGIKIWKERPGVGKERETKCTTILEAAHMTPVLVCIERGQRL